MKFTRTILLFLAVLPVSFSVYGGDTVRSTLPLIIIHTNGQQIPDEPKIPVSMGIITGTSNSPSDPFNDYNGLAGIEIRGSSSQMFDKKAYGFETWSQPGMDTSVSLMGLPAENDWVLHGPFSDKSLIRNALVYHLYGMMGHYSPRARLCELYINDDYRGVYLLVEKIKRDKNRVNIAKLTEKDTTGPALTGGYILKLDKSTGSANNLSFTSNYWPYVGSDLPDFMVAYPDGDNILPAQMDYIRHHINDFETVLHGANFKDPINGYRAYIDVNSFIDYFIINELSKNVDGFRLSSYLYKDRDDRDPKLYAGPVWDYDLAFGNADYSDAWEVSGWQYETDGGGAPVPFWWERLLQDKYFTGKLRCRWEDLRKGLLSSDSLISNVDSLVNTVGKAAGRNFKKYPILGIYVWPNYYIGYDYPSEVYYLESWILDRMSYMDRFLPGTCLPASLEENKEASFKAVVFPNPSAGNIHLEISNPAQKVLQLTVYDMKGSPLAIRRFEKNMKITCDIPARPGIYQVILTDGMQVVPVKAVVE
jgi:hypothetical protein